MGLETKCDACGGKGVSWSGRTCRRCDGVGEVKPYRKLPTLWYCSELGFDPMLDFEPLGEKGKCCVCSAKLEKRQRRYCSKHRGGWEVHQRLYRGIHWMKRHVCVRDGCACRFCGEVFESPIVEGGPIYPEPRSLELDHIQALHLGGTDHANNLQLLCPGCHKLKSIEERR